MKKSGKVRQYRLFRANVNFQTSSRLYPYDTQNTTLMIQSLDHGNNEIQLTTKALDSLNGENLSDIQVRFLKKQRTSHLGPILNSFWIGH